MEKQPGIVEIGRRTIGALVLGAAINVAIDNTAQNVYADGPKPSSTVTATNAARIIIALSETPVEIPTTTPVVETIPS